MVKEGPGAEVLEFRLAHLEVRRRTMQAGAESDYLSRVLANRTRCRTVDSWAAPCFRLWEPFLSFAMESARRETQTG